jgi:hypothetical protein
MIRTTLIAAALLVGTVAVSAPAHAYIFMNGGSENGVTLNGSGENGLTLNGAGENGITLQGPFLQGRSSQGTSGIATRETGSRVISIEF